MIMSDRGTRRPSLRWVALALPVVLAAAASGVVAADGGTTARVSVASDGSEGNDSSGDVAITGDGRYVAFESDADNLVPDDTNARDDIFVHDWATGITERVSVASDATEGNANSNDPAISADGRYVAFESSADNLVPDDTNGRRDIFVHDRATGITERVSVADDGTEADNSSGDPAISADGLHVAFSGTATNLVAGDTNGRADVFVHDRSTGTTERVSVASDGTEGNGSSSGRPAISADGRYVGFRSPADNLVLGDTNQLADVFLHDRAAGTTVRVSVASDGTEGNQSSGNPALSDDGRYIAFDSHADNLVAGDTNLSRDIFVHDRDTGITERVSLASDGTEADTHSGDPAISPDGRFAGFSTTASNLVPGDTNDAFDIFVHDRDTGITERVSVASDATGGNARSLDPAIGIGSRHVAFESIADNLVPGDTNGEQDIFIRSRPELVVSPDPLDFGPVLVGQTNGPTGVTITNPRQAQITITEISAPQAPFTAGGGTCGALPFTLTLGESCELAYSFSPASAGAFESAVTLTSDAPDSPHTFTLRGLGVEEALVIAPGVLDFGSALPGDTVGPASVVLSNANGVAAGISALTTPGAPFAAAGGTCGPAPFTVQPFTSCTLDYSFSPTDGGVFGELIELSHDAPSGPASFTLQGEGLARALSVTPALLAFGNVPLGESGGPLDITLTSVGTLDVALGGASDPGAPFALTQNTCGAVLAPGSSCTLAYSYTPTAPESRLAEVTIASDAESNPHTVTLFGAGVVHGTELVSRATGVDGAKGDNDSEVGVISADGRFVAFRSGANNLHPDDTNNNPNELDIFLRDTRTHETFLVSRADGIDGAEGDWGSLSPSISADGRYVAFQSAATNFHPDDAGETPDEDVYVRDMVTHETILVSRAAGAGGAKGNGDSGQPSLSADGRLIAFSSVATNLHPDDTDQAPDIFIRDLQTDELFLVSRAGGVDGAKGNDGSVFPSLSADGRFVAFESGATNLHPDDSDGSGDIFVRDLQTHENILVSRASGASGVKANIGANQPSISADGRRVAFESQSTTLHPDDDEPCPSNCDTDIFVRDLQTHETMLASRASGADGATCQSHSTSPSISADGRWVAFDSQCMSFHPDDVDAGNLNDVFVRDLLTHETLLASRVSGVDGDVSNRTSLLPSISADGRFVAFASVATNLHPDDDDFQVDMYVRDLLGVAEPQLVLEPASLDFGGVTVGDTSPPQTATLTNIAFGDADLTGVGFVGLPASGFAHVTDCGASLSAGASCEISIAFTPTALGPAAATLQVSSDQDAVATLSLSGTGLALAPRIDVDPESLASTLPQGQMEARSLTISNAGEAALDWEVTDGGALNGQLLRPAGSVTAVSTVAAPTETVEGMARDEVTESAGTTASQSFPAAVGNEVSLTHSASPQILAGNSPACANSDGTTTQSSYLRAFTLTDFGITSAFDVTDVTFAVESLGATASITVKLYSLEGEFTAANLSLIGSQTQELSAQNLTLVTVPVTGTVPTGSTLVVEIAAPDLSSVTGFRAGSNDLGETAPSYIAAPACGVLEPTPFADIGFSGVHLVMAVFGTFESPDCTMPGWLGVAPTSGSVAIGDSQPVDLSFDATGLLIGDYEANLCLNSNDPEQPLTVVPLTLTVLEAEPELSITPTALDFGEVPVGAIAGPAPVTLANAGDADLHVSTVSDPAAPFARAGGSCGAVPFVIPGGASCTLDFTFGPTQTGNAIATVDLVSNAPSNPDVFALAGTGSDAPTSAVLLEPTRLYFGNVELLQQSAPSTITVKNVGVEPLQVDRVAVAAGAAGDYPLIDGCTGATLDFGQSCVVEVVFEPQRTGTRLGWLEVFTDTPGSPDAAKLVGSGITADGIWSDGYE